MRKRTLWRLSPTEAEEYFVRSQAKKEGRELSKMIHVLLGEAISARQAAQRQTSKLVSLLRGEADADAAQ
jgi:hypothetical protein